MKDKKEQEGKKRDLNSRQEKKSDLIDWDIKGKIEKNKQNIKMMEKEEER